MLIVITAEEYRADELDLINQMFNLGLESLHIRKKGISKLEYKYFINQIEKQYLNRVVIHQYHDLLEEFDIGGIHITSTKRTDLKKAVYNYIDNYKRNKKITVSSSFHQLTEFDTSNNLYDYVFLSPVFDSVSKLGYIGKGYDVNGLDQRIIALGGIDSENIDTVSTLGYNGIGVIGSIWKTKDVIASYKKLADVFNLSDMS